jgi:hypothetical protein
MADPLAFAQAPPPPTGQPAVAATGQQQAGEQKKSFSQQDFDERCAARDRVFRDLPANRARWCPTAPTLQTGFAAAARCEPA